MSAGAARVAVAADVLAVAVPRVAVLVLAGPAVPAVVVGDTGGGRDSGRRGVRNECREHPVRQPSDSGHETSLDVNGCGTTTIRFAAAPRADLGPSRTEMPVRLPDPDQADCLDELVAQLRLLKACSRNTSYAAIARIVNDRWKRAARAVNELTTNSTAAGYFTFGRSRLDEDLLVAIVSSLCSDP